MKTLRLLLAAALTASGLTACKNVRPVSQATHEGPRVTLFPHQKHGGFDCVDCHTGIPKSTRLGQAALPGVAKCEECHEVKNPTDDQSRKVRAAADLLSQPREPRDYQITMNHAVHLPRIKEKEITKLCQTCHRDLLEPGPAKDVTPPMAACTACHEHAQAVAQARCSPCHVSLRAYPLKPIEALATFSHQGNWIREHGNVAKGGAGTCAQCHDQTYCSNCHANATVPFRPEVKWPERVTTDFIHRSDFVSRHQIEAGADPASCRKCHGSYFCDSCHKAQDLSPRTRDVPGRTLNNPHPDGWARRGGTEFHGDRARQNIVTCAACHDQGANSICIGCHNSRGPGLPGPGGNPHPPGYASKHPRADIPKGSACLACHRGG
jgi:hypothetical protein